MCVCVCATYAQTTSEVNDARLGCPIDGYYEHGIQPDNGAHVDHKSSIAAILLAHVLQCTQAGIDDASLGGEKCIPLGVFYSALGLTYQIHQQRTLHILIVKYSSYIYHNINAAKGLLDLLVGGLDALPIGHIHFDDHHTLRGMRGTQLDKLLQIILQINDGNSLWTDMAHRIRWTNLCRLLLPLRLP